MKTADRFAEIESRIARLERAGRPSDEVPWREAARISVSTLARIGGEHPRTIRRRIDAGEIPAQKVHGRIWIQAHDVRVYLGETETESPPFDPNVAEYVGKLLA